MTEADAGLPETTEGALSLSKARLDAQAPKPATPKAPPVAPEQPSKAQAATGAEADGTKPAGQSTPNAVDFSYIADPELRAALEKANLPDTATKSLKGWVADYTKKSQAASANERKAQAWEAAESLPGFKAAMAALVAKTEAPEVVDEPEVDLTQADNKTIWAAVRAEAKKIARAEAGSLVQERVFEPVTSQQKIVAEVVGMFPEWQDRLDKETFRLTWDEARAHYGDEAFTPQNVPVLFKPFLERAAVSAELAVLKGKRTKDSEAALKAISPAGGGSIATRGADAPKAKPDGKRETAREATKAELLARFGWSESDLEAAARPGF